MVITRRRGAIALAITLGSLIFGGLIAFYIPWILLTKSRIALLALGLILFGLLTAGVVLNTVFLVREVRRNERQDSFLNAATHELKTPIASIRLYLETLQNRDLTEAQRQQFYTIMLADSDRLLSTVQQILKAGELGARRHPHRVPIELTPLVAECIAITLRRNHLPAESIQLTPVPGGVPLYIQAIPGDLRAAILNLLDNAVKYSTDEVCVRCSLDIVRYTSVALSITDSGAGLAPDQLKRIFKRFYRVPGRNAALVKGTGLGLFLVRAIARQHGGRVSATSPGHNLGATFTLTLPLTESPPNSPAQPPPESP